MATQDRITNLSTQMSKQQDNAMETYMAQMLSAKQPLLLSYQRKEITAEEYERTTGETVVETLAQMYALDHRRQLRQMYDRVEAGHITEAECEAITGEPYDPLAISPLRIMASARQAVKQAATAPADNAETPSGAAESKPAGAQNVTVDASMEG